MNHYTHFTLKERELLKYFIDIGKNQIEISVLLGRNKSSISREIRRNSQNGEYIPCEAHETYKKRRLSCRPIKKSDDSNLFNTVKDLYLNHQWSPEQISARLKFENSSFAISYNTIYREIYNGKFDETGLSRGNRGAIRKLRHRGKSRHTKNYEEKRGKHAVGNRLL